MARREILDLFADEPGLGPFFLARSISIFGSAVAPVALAFAVFDLPGGSADTLGLILGAYALARVLTLLMGGVLADRYGAQRVMITAEIFAGMTQATFAFLILQKTSMIGLLTALSFLSGAANALFLPSFTGLIPQLAHKSKLKKLNSLIILTTNAANILGAAAAGMLVSYIGSGWALMLDAATFFFGALLLAMIRRGEFEKDAPRESMIQELIHGWKAFTAHQWVWMIVAAYSILNAAFRSSFSVLGPLVAKESYGGAVGFSIMTASESVGLVLGSLLVMRLRVRYPMRIGLIVTNGFTAPFIALALNAPLAVVSFCSAVSGVCISIFAVIWDTSLQENIPQDRLARVSAYDWLGSIALNPLALAIVAPVSERIGTTNTLYLSAGLIMLSCNFPLLFRSARNLPGAV